MTDQRKDPQDLGYDPEMTEGDEANVPEGTREQIGEDEEAMARQGDGIPRDPERPT